MIEAVDVAVTPAVAAARPPAPVAVVIDVLRATSTIVTALDNGAAGIIPVLDPDAALTVLPLARLPFTVKANQPLRCGRGESGNRRGRCMEPSER